MKSNSNILTFLLFVICSIHNPMASQCTPPPSDNCEDVAVMCSLDELNGYTCKNADYYNPTGCSPLCPSGGGTHNTSWWGFVTQGGNVCVTISFSNCTVNGTGTQFGIWGDCSCSESIFCDPSCSGPGQKIACGVLEACKTYYLFVDGCTGDVCDFTLSCSGGPQPSLPPLPNISGPLSICKGACGIEYDVSIAGPCQPQFEWLLDGVKLDQFTGKIKLDFPDEGDFTLCVTALIGNTQSGSICDQEGPKCVTIRVRPSQDRVGIPRVLCFEHVPFKWHDNLIMSEGDYRQNFKTKECCEYDSVVNFRVLEKPEPGSVFFIGCKGESFTDPSGRKVSKCEDGFNVQLLDATVPYRCDSSVNVYATFIEGFVRFDEYCLGGNLLLEASVIDKTCNVQGYTCAAIEFNWFLKNDPSKSSIGIEKYLEVVDKNDYCCEIRYTGQLDAQTKICYFTMCETIDEDSYRYKEICPIGEELICYNNSATYTSSAKFPKDALHIWHVDGGTIVTPNPESSSSIDVLWNKNIGNAKEYIGSVCYRMQSQCPETEQCCKSVRVRVTPKPDAGPDLAICGRSLRLKGKFDVGAGTWTQISGPKVNFTSVTEENPDLIATDYGRCEFELKESIAGCDGTDRVIVDFNQGPQKSSAIYFCNGNKDYNFNFSLSNIQGVPRILKGNGTITGNEYRSGQILNNQWDTVMITDNSGCQLVYINRYECKCFNEIGSLSRLEKKLCDDGTFLINYDTTNQKLDRLPRDTVMFFVYQDPADPMASMMKYLNTNTFAYDPALQYDRTYYVGALLGKINGKGGIDFSQGCVRMDAGSPFTFYEKPKPNAGADQVACGTQIQLNGISSINGSKIEWREKNGASVLFGNSNDPKSPVQAMSGYKTYSLIMKEISSNGLCISEDEMDITFNSNPEITNIEKSCTRFGAQGQTDGKYVVKASISNGKSPFQLINPSSANGKIVGNDWISDTLISLENFVISIQDANQCVSTLVTDNYNCNCGNIDAGELDGNPVQVCKDNCVSLNSVVDEIINPAEDVVNYILHTTYTNYNDPNGILRILSSKNEQICYDPQRMILGSANAVYLSRVVGDDLNPKDGKVDVSDPCKRVSKPMKIIFEPKASPDAGPDLRNCGLNYTFSGQLSFGSANWALISGPGAAIISNPTDLKSNVLVDNVGKYEFELTGEHFGCSVKDRVIVEFLDSPEFDHSSVTYVSDNVAEKYKVRVNALKGDRSTWEIIATVNQGTAVLIGSFIIGDVWESDWIASGTDYEIKIRDANRCGEDRINGSHLVKCITEISELKQNPIDVCIDQSASLQISSLQVKLDPNDELQFVLFEGDPNSPLSSNIIAKNKTGQFSFESNKMNSSKDYYIAALAGNKNPLTGELDLKDRCLVYSNGLRAHWFEYPLAKIDGLTELNCRDSEIKLDGANSKSVSGDPLKFSWNTTESSSSISVKNKNTYSLTVEDPRAACKSTVHHIVTEDFEMPKIEIEIPQSITCDRNEVELSAFKSDRGPKYVGLWSAPNGSNEYQTKVDKKGDYTFSLENKINGCVSKKTISVGEDKMPPIALIKKQSDLTCRIDQTYLEASDSKDSRGTKNLSFNWIGNILNGQGSERSLIQKPGGTYILEVKDLNNGCISAEKIIVTEIGNPLNEIVLDIKDPKCFGDNNGSVQIKEVLNDQNQKIENLRYSINGSAFVSSTEFNNLEKGSYALLVRNEHGCELSKEIILHEPEKMNLDVVHSIIVEEGSTVNLNLFLKGIYGGSKDPNGFYSDTSWYSLEDQSAISNKSSMLADKSRTIIITGKDANGCTVTERINLYVKVIKEIWWPNIINPSSANENNNTFNVYSKKAVSIRALQIYNRWGELVYTANNLKDANHSSIKGWAGSFLGKEAEAGNYVFMAEIQYEDSEQSERISGMFSVVR